MTEITTGAVRGVQPNGPVIPDEPLEDAFCDECGFRLDLHGPGYVSHPSELEAREAYGDR